MRKFAYCNLVKQVRIFFCFNSMKIIHVYVFYFVQNNANE
jgi:hypothetical protein